MMTTQHSPLSVRVLAKLLSYPNADLRRHLGEMATVIRSENAFSKSRCTELLQLIQVLQSGDGLKHESNYVELFDRGRATSLHLFEHVHGDSRDRGPAMIDLAQTYEKAGLILAPGELPDYLPVVLEFVSTQPLTEARAFLLEIAHIINVIFQALVQRDSAYASVLGALLDLAGEKAHAVKIVQDAPLDETWEEPVVFDGCSTKGQAKPDQEQALHFVKKESLHTGNGNGNGNASVHQGAAL